MHRHLDDVETRLEQLEKLISHHLPGINVEEALRSPTPLHINRASSLKSDGPDTPGLPREAESNDQPENEALPPEASGFDWRETAIDLNGLADGMASLSLDPSGKGYLGTYPDKTAIELHELIYCVHQGQLPALWS